MAVLAECDICGNQHRVKDATVGRPIRCKACGVQIVVPAGSTISPETYLEEAGRLRRRSPAHSAPPWTWIVVGLVTMGLLGMTVGALTFCTMIFRITPENHGQEIRIDGCQHR